MPSQASKLAASAALVFIAALVMLTAPDVREPLSTAQTKAPGAGGTAPGALIVR